MEELPFKAEYAKSGRSGCKACKRKIGQDTLRLAIIFDVSEPLLDCVNRFYCVLHNRTY